MKKFSFASMIVLSPSCSTNLNAPVPFGLEAALLGFATSSADNIGRNDDK